jgi:hypothetical protein
MKISFIIHLSGLRCRFLQMDTYWRKCNKQHIWSLCSFLSFSLNLHFVWELNRETPFPVEYFKSASFLFTSASEADTPLNPQTNLRNDVQSCLLGYTASIIPDDGGSTHLWNVGRQSFYTAVYPRRQLWTTYSPPWELEISQTYGKWDADTVTRSTHALPIIPTTITCLHCTHVMAGVHV